MGEKWLRTMRNDISSPSSAPIIKKLNWGGGGGKEEGNEGVGDLLTCNEVLSRRNEGGGETFPIYTGT